MYPALGMADANQYWSIYLAAGLYDISLQLYQINNGAYYGLGETVQRRYLEAGTYDWNENLHPNNNVRLPASGNDLVRATLRLLF